AVATEDVNPLVTRGDAAKPTTATRGCVADAEKIALHESPCSSTEEASSRAFALASSSREMRSPVAPDADRAVPLTPSIADMDAERSISRITLDPVAGPALIAGRPTAIRSNARRSSCSSRIHENRSHLNGV